MRVTVYLDESGDLGWKFDAPYRSGGSSRYLTIAAIVIDHEKRHLLKRVMKKLYRKTATPNNEEVKWAYLDNEQRCWIAQELANFKAKHGSGVHYYSISVRKDKVMQHIRSDANKLYNYMIKLLLAQELSTHQHVFLNVDQRSIKVESGRSLHDYLQTTIWFEHGAQTVIETTQCNSKGHLGVQLADILSGIVQSHFEDTKTEPYRILADYSHIKRLYF